MDGFRILVRYYHDDNWSSLQWENRAQHELNDVLLTPGPRHVRLPSPVLVLKVQSLVHHALLKQAKDTRVPFWTLDISRNRHKDRQEARWRLVSMFTPSERTTMHGSFATSLPASGSRINMVLILYRTDNTSIGTEAFQFSYTPQHRYGLRGDMESFAVTSRTEDRNVVGHIIQREDQHMCVESVFSVQVVQP